MQSSSNLASANEVSRISGEAQTMFHMEINQSRVVKASSSGRCTVIAAPVTTVATKDDWHSIAVVNFAYGDEIKEHPRTPPGTYILQSNGPNARYVDSRGGVVAEGPVTTGSALRSNTQAGWVHIAVEVVKVCTTYTTTLPSGEVVTKTFCMTIN